MFRWIDQADSMTIIRVALHSLVLVIADIAGIAGGAVAAFKILGVPNQVWLQVPLAVVLSAGCFCAWILSLRVLRWKRLQPAGSKELGACLAVSLVWAPLVFGPLHYFTQGYVTSLGNLVALALYQLPVNALALLGSSILPKAASDQSPPNDPLQNGGPARQSGNSGAAGGRHR